MTLSTPSQGMENIVCLKPGSPDARELRMGVSFGNGGVLPLVFLDAIVSDGFGKQAFDDDILASGQHSVSSLPSFCRRWYQSTSVQQSYTYHLVSSQCTKKPTIIPCLVLSSSLAGLRWDTFPAYCLRYLASAQPIQGNIHACNGKRGTKCCFGKC